MNTQTGMEDRKVQALQSLAKTKRRRRDGGGRGEGEKICERDRKEESIRQAWKQKFPRRERASDFHGVCSPVSRLNGDCCYRHREKRQAALFNETPATAFILSTIYFCRGCSNSSWNC